MAIMDIMARLLWFSKDLTRPLLGYSGLKWFGCVLFVFLVVRFSRSRHQHSCSTQHLNATHLKETADHGKSLVLALSVSSAQWMSLYSPASPQEAIPLSGSILHGWDKLLRASITSIIGAKASAPPSAASHPESLPAVLMALRTHWWSRRERGMAPAVSSSFGLSIQCYISTVSWLSAAQAFKLVNQSTVIMAYSLGEMLQSFHPDPGLLQTWLQYVHLHGHCRGHCKKSWRITPNTCGTKC